MFSTDDELPWPEDAVEVGRIIEPWGIKGWLRVQPYAKDPKALFSSRRWFLKLPEAAVRPAGAPAVPTVLRITQAKSHADGVVAAAQEVPDRSAAETLKGVRIFVSRASFPTAGSDEYYWVDLIGLDVVNRAGVLLGSVTDLIDTGANSVLCVRLPVAAQESAETVLDAPVSSAAPPDAVAPAAQAPGARARRGRAAKPAREPVAERLIPFVAAYVDEVRLAERRILVDWDVDY